MVILQNYDFLFIVIEYPVQQMKQEVLTKTKKKQKDEKVFIKRQSNNGVFIKTLNLTLE